MDQLNLLLEYFPTGTTEGERHILKKAFVQIDELADIITPPPSSPRLLIGKKGSGKSAIIDFSTSLFKKTNIPCVCIKPMDIDLSKIPDSSSVGDITRIAFSELTRSVAKTIGSSLTGLLDKDDKSLYDEAVRDGLIEKDYIEKLAPLLAKLAKPIINADISDLLPNTPPSSRESLLNAINRNLLKTERGFYLFIDDTDQIAAPDKPGHLNRIWGFILAARELTQRCENLRCIISLREEIWRRITNDKAGQRDQTDHFSNLIKEISPSKDHIKEIINTRIKLAALDFENAGKIDKKINANNKWLYFFDPEQPKIPMSNERSSWPDLITTRSRERPRDAIQLISNLARNAISKNCKINEEIFAKEMVVFSKQRVSLLAQENEYECPQLEQIIRTFADLNFDFGSFKATAESIKKHIATRCCNIGAKLYGTSIRTNNIDDVFAIWKFLFETGFLNARISDINQKDNYKHVLPKDDQNFIVPSRWSEIQATIWEIGPAYRDFLIQIQDEQRNKIGLPSSGRRKNTRR